MSWALTITSDGSQVFVANASSNLVSVIATGSTAVIAHTVGIPAKLNAYSGRNPNGIPG